MKVLLSILATSVMVLATPPKVHVKPKRAQIFNFTNTILNADRIVFYRGALFPNSDQPPPIAFTIENHDQIQSFLTNIKFNPTTHWDICLCMGYPRVDFFAGNSLLATTAIIHCDSIRWSGFAGDADLTSSSSEWLRKFLSAHNVQIQ